MVSYLLTLVSVYHWTCTHDENLCLVCAARWTFRQSFLGPLPRKDTERGLRVVWPVQMLYELMRSMWEAGAVWMLEENTDYFPFSFFLLTPLLTNSKPALAKQIFNSHPDASAMIERDTSGAWCIHIKMTLVKPNKTTFCVVSHVSGNALMMFGSESGQQPTLSQSSTPSPSSRDNRSTTSSPETAETMRNILEAVYPTQVCTSLFDFGIQQENFYRFIPIFFRKQQASSDQIYLR